MGDAAKRVKNRGFMDEEDFKRSPGKQSYLAHDGHGNNLGRKLDTQKSKPIPYSSSPRNGSSQNMFKNFSPGGRAGTNYKDEGKRWSAEEQRGCNNWRERRPQAFNRTRNDSTGERGEGCRWQEAGERQNQLGRSPLQKGAFPEDASDHTGISGNLRFTFSVWVFGQMKCISKLYNTMALSYKKYKFYKKKNHNLNKQMCLQ